ncbi:MAG: hypothetical protein AMXMBFR13_24830 [Phycisphaerae bacterium]
MQVGGALVPVTHLTVGAHGPQEAFDHLLGVLLGDLDVAVFTGMGGKALRRRLVRPHRRRGADRTPVDRSGYFGRGLGLVGADG